MGSPEYVVNNGGNSSYGRYYSYKNFNTTAGATTPNGGDIASFTVAEWPNAVSGITGFTQWQFGISPYITDADSSTRAFSLVGTEINLAHRMPTTGWTEFDPKKTGADLGVPKWNSVGMQISPDAWSNPDHPGGPIRKGGHVNLGYSVFPDAAGNNDRNPAYVNGIYSPFHIGNNAVAPGGRGMYFGGDNTNTPANYPYAGIEARYNWPMFLNLEHANLTSGWIVNAKPGQSYRWATAAGDVSLGATADGKLTIAAPGGVTLPATAWTSYTPTYTSSGGSGVTISPVSARYEVTGKTLRMRATMQVFYTGTPPTAIEVGMPNGLALFDEGVGTAANVNSQAVLAAWANNAAPNLTIHAGTNPIVTTSNQYVLLSFTGEIQ